MSTMRVDKDGIVLHKADAGRTRKAKAKDTGEVAEEFWVPCATQRQVKELFKEYHDDLGHCGELTVWQTMRRGVYFDGMRTWCKLRCDACPTW